jgi:hypothetical protein
LPWTTGISGSTNLVFVTATSIPAFFILLLAVHLFLKFDLTELMSSLWTSSRNGLARRLRLHIYWDTRRSSAPAMQTQERALGFVENCSCLGHGNSKKEEWTWLNLCLNFRTLNLEDNLAVNYEVLGFCSFCSTLSRVWREKIRVRSKIRGTLNQVLLQRLSYSSKRRMKSTSISRTSTVINDSVEGRQFKRWGHFRRPIHLWINIYEAFKHFEVQQEAIKIRHTGPSET